MKKTLLFLSFAFTLAVQSQTYLSEIMVDPPDADNPNEYIELRGVPNATLSDTYLIVVEGDDADPGDLNSVHDLSGLSFGSNGYLVLLNSGHPYTVDPKANVVTGILSPGGGNLEGQTHSFMLVEAPVAPNTNDDIDSDNDGVADGAPFNTWTVLDSGVAFVRDNQNGNDPANNSPAEGNEVYLYSDVIFVEDADNVVLDPVINAGPNAVFVRTGGTQFEYAARIGNSTGSLLTDDVTTSDWSGGNINGNDEIAINGIWQVGTGGSAVRGYPLDIEGETLDNIGAANFPNIWTGDIDSDWGNEGNWTNGEVPKAYETAVINDGLTNYPTISSEVIVAAVNMESGTSLIANAALTGDVTYNRTLTDNWHLIASPVIGETIEDVIANHTLLTGTGTNIGLAPYTVNPAGWDYQAATSVGGLNNGQGYSVRLASAGDISFTGSVNSTDVNPAVMSGADSFNLIGNPFTSYIDSETFLTENSDVLSESTIWVWDGAQYVTYNNMVPLNIAPTQGFFVDAFISGDLAFLASNQSHEATDTFLKQEPVANFELSIQNATASSSTKVFYLEGKTAGFDNGYDSKMFGGIATDFAVFTELVSGNQANKLAIQTLSNDDSNAIPVGLIAKAGEEIIFSVETTNIANRGDLYLENKLTGDFINLSEESYKVTLAEDANGAGQFYIHTVAKSLSVIDEDLDKISVYSSRKQLTVGGLNSSAKLSVFSLLGTEVITTTLESNGVSKVDLSSLNTGVYVISLISDLGTINKKIILE